MSALAATGAEPWFEPVPRYWCGGDVFGTRLLEAMSLIAPEMERFVIGAVLASARIPQDAEWRSRALAFVHEEAGHSRVHRTFNRRLLAQGVDVAEALDWVRRAARLARNWLPRSDRLAVAAASEHVSSVLSLCFLRSSLRSVIRPASVFRLFELHACDELGHRAIVFDLSRTAGAARWPARAAALALVSCVALLCVPRVVDALLRFEPPGSRARLWAQVALRLLRGCARGAPAAFLRGWLSYLKPGFHPSQLPER